MVTLTLLLLLVSARTPLLKELIDPVVTTTLALFSEPSTSASIPYLPALVMLPSLSTKTLPEDLPSVS